MQLNDRIPYATQPKLKKILDTLKEQDIIVDVHKLTEWVSNIVVVEKKNGSLRLCLARNHYTRRLNAKDTTFRPLLMCSHSCLRRGLSRLLI